MNFYYKVLKINFLVLLISLVTTSVCAQDVIRSADKTSIWSFTLPDNNVNGPMDVTAVIDYYFTFLSSTNQVVLHYTFSNMYFATKYNGAYRYKYKNQMYSSHVMQVQDFLGLDYFDDVKITGLVFDVNILGGGQSQRISMNDNYPTYLTNFKFSKTESINQFSINFATATATRINYDNEEGAEKRIVDYNNLVSSRDAYKTLISKADQAFDAGNWAEAKSKYSEASALLWKENYPKQQLEKIKNIQDKEAKVNSDANKAKNNQSNNPLNSSYSNNSYNNNTTSGSTPSSSTKKNTSTSTGSNNYQSQQSYSNSSNASGGKINMSNAVKTQNGDEVKVYQQNGKNYAEYQDGSSREISLDMYNNVQAASNTNIKKNAEYEKQKSEIEKANAAIEKSNADIIAKSNERSKKLNDQIENYNNGSSYTPEYSGNSTLDKVSNVMNAATPLINQWAAQAEAERANRQANEEAALYRQAEAEERAAEAARAKAAEVARVKAEKQKLVALRKLLILTYPDGKTPLSYQAKENSEVYFFAYSHQPSSLEDANPKIYISNVFSVAKYGDGTWPFKANLISNIAKKNNELPLTLSGYYLSRQEAEQQQQTFKSEAMNCNFSINSIQYTSKSDTKKSTTTDSWGESIKNEVPVKQPETDYWGNPIKNAPVDDKKKPEPENVAPQPIKKEVKFDYWGNPIKE